MLGATNKGPRVVPFRVMSAHGCPVWWKYLISPQCAVAGAVSRAVAATLA